MGNYNEWKKENLDKVTHLRGRAFAVDVKSLGDLTIEELSEGLKSDPQFFPQRLAALEDDVQFLKTAFRRLVEWTENCPQDK